LDRNIFLPKWFTKKARLKPLFPAEVKEKANTHGEHHPQQNEIAVFPTQFRHVVKVHPIYSSEEAERDENGGDNGEHLHDVVHAKTDLREVEVMQAMH
jgi:hypothetical protein